MSIGANLKEKRKAQGISSNELGAKVGITGSMIRQIERGARALTLALAYDIAKILGCSVMDFLDDKSV